MEVANIISRLFPTNLQRYPFVFCSRDIVEQNTLTIKPFILLDTVGCEKRGLTLLTLESFVKYKGFETFSERLSQVTSTVPFSFIYSLLKPLNSVRFFFFSFYFLFFAFFLYFFFFIVLFTILFYFFSIILLSFYFFFFIYILELHFYYSILLEPYFYHFILIFQQQACYFLSRDFFNAKITNLLQQVLETLLHKTDFSDVVEEKKRRIFKIIQMVERIMYRVYEV
jgi:hypothetical protein